MPGTKYPSVTQVLGVYSDFSRVPAQVLQHAAERGRRVHAACSAYARGLWVPSLGYEDEPYVNSFKKWFDLVVDRVYLAEAELVDEALGFCGHPDLVVLMKGDEVLSVPDLKTPVAHNPLWRAQLAAYKHLVEIRFGKSEKVGRVFSLRLSPEGKLPKLDEYTQTTDDLRAFLSALNAYRFFKAA